MIEKVFRSTHLVRRLRNSLLGSAFDDLVEYLISRGHSTETIRQYVQGVAHFDSWLRRTRRTVEAIDEGVLRDFIRHLSHCRCPRPCSTTVRDVRPPVRHLLVVLRRTGRARPPAARKTPPATKVVDAFVAHMREQGAAPETCRAWTRYAEEFLRDRFGAGEIDFSRIKVHHVTDFFVARSGRWTPRSMMHAASALRGFFRYLQLVGRMDGRLAHAVPKFPVWRLASVPRVLTAEQMATVLGSFDRSTSTGLRGYAITMCLAGLGLRSCEVAALALDDIDWRAGTITVCATKTRRADVLPLPAAIARAILAYLRRGRPETNSRQIFVRHRAPLGPSSGPNVVACTVRTACIRAGVPPFSVTPHMFRHTVATRLLRAGATMKDVADVLRHRSINTTAIYAKVDLEALQEVAGAWPRRTS